MKLFTLLLFACASLAAISADAAPAQIRGAWISAWEKGYLTPEEADATIAAAKKAKLNTLFIQVRKTADAYYNSQIEPVAPNLPPNYDPLAYMIEKAHQQGISVHAWINVCRVWIGKKLPDDPNHIVNKHPDWLNRDYKGNNRATDGMFIDPGVPEAREYVVSVISDIAKRYDVDGIHLDYIRYPGTDWGYSQAALSRFMAETGRDNKPSAGDTKWSVWRRDQVTQLLIDIREGVLAVRPKAQITAATIAWKSCTKDFCDSLAYNRVYQDWRRWVVKGYIDANVPMNYRSDDGKAGATQFRGWLTGFKRWSGKTPTYVGIDVYHNTAKALANQIRSTNNSSLAGFVLFSFNDTPERQRIMNALDSLN